MKKSVNLHHLSLVSSQTWGPLPRKQKQLPDGAWWCESCMCCRGYHRDMHSRKTSMGGDPWILWFQPGETEMPRSRQSMATYMVYPPVFSSHRMNFPAIRKTSIDLKKLRGFSKQPRGWLAEKSQETSHDIPFYHHVCCVNQLKSPFLMVKSHMVYRYTPFSTNLPLPADLFQGEGNTSGASNSGADLRS